MPPTTHSIGQLASLSGLPVKTIRFYSDAGLLPPTARTAAGHRRYTGADLARLQLIRSLRDLDLDLPTIRRVLDAQADLGDVLATHVAALETRIRALQRQLAVLRAAADAPSEATIRRTLALARLNAAERRALLERFWERVTAGSPLDDQTLDPLRRAGVAELPDDPSGEQVDAWLELAELASDEDFIRATRDAAAWMAREAPGRAIDGRRLQARSGEAMAGALEAMAAGVRPDDARAAAVLDALVSAYAHALGRRDSRPFRRRLLELLEAQVDPRAERYWQLVGIIRGQPSPAEGRRTMADAFNWLMEALGHDVAARARR